MYREKTSENHKAFLGCYYGQEVVTIGDPRMLMPDHKVDEFSIGINAFGLPIILWDIKSINHKDAKSLGFANASNFLKLADISKFKDELRSLGYAVEWNGVSVEEQINRGWVILDEKQKTSNYRGKSLESGELLTGPLHSYGDRAAENRFCIKGKEIDKSTVEVTDYEYDEMGELIWRKLNFKY